MRDRLMFAALGLALSLAGCNSQGTAGRTYFEREVQPILTASCEGGVSACHRDDGNGVALGNLDVSSFDAIKKRGDVLRRFSSYEEPLLLIKAAASKNLSVHYDGEFYPLEIAHAGGQIFEPGSDAYFTLSYWLLNGATENGLPPPENVGTNEGGCSDRLSDLVDLATVASSDPGFAEFDAIQSSLVEQCGSGTCHGAPLAAFHLACGDTDEQRKQNYVMARAFVAPNVDDSPLLTKALDPSAGGIHHVGGSIYASTDDSGFAALRSWAETAGMLTETNRSPGRVFFDERVQPVLLQRGCGFEACHSPIAPFKVNLQPGSPSFTSSLANKSSYNAAKKFLGLESPNPISSRIIAKNIVSSKGGIKHRGGPILETAGAGDEPANCVQPYDPTNATALCTIVEWKRLEREAIDPRYQANLAALATVPVVYVERPADAVRSIVDFAAHRPGADLIRADATIGSGASVSSLAGVTSLLGGCPGVGASRADVDVRAPEPSHDGTRVVFAMRIGSASGLDIYEVGIDGSGCRKLTSDGGTVVSGIKIESFDPYYVTDDDDVEWVVYASSRGGTNGPTRAPKLFQPNTDLWRQPLSGGSPEQLTFLSGAEAQPFGMNNGMMAMITEKASAEFYQFGARRLNWDRSDYHPLLGQRKSSFAGRNGYLPGAVPAEAMPVNSIGFSQVSEVRNAVNDDFLVVLSDTGSYGEGGALGIFNRSVGPFELGRDDPGFLKSLTLLPGPSGRAGEATGVYRSPYPLPDTNIMASYADGADPGSTAAKRYDLVIVNRQSGERQTLRSGGALSLVEAVLVAPRPPPHTFTRKPSTEETASPEMAVLSYADIRLLATLQGANDRHFRDVDSLRAATKVRYFRHEPPPLSCLTPADCMSQLAGSEAVFADRREVGAAAIAEDGSVFVRVPANVPLLLELLDANDNVLYRMQEETQFGPNENIGLAVPERAYPTLCGVCHGAISGRDLDITVDIDAVTTASLNLARTQGIANLQ